MSLFTFNVEVYVHQDVSESIDEQLKRISHRLDKLTADSELANVTRNIIDPMLVKVANNMNVHTPETDEHNGE